MNKRSKSNNWGQIIGVRVKLIRDTIISFKNQKDDSWQANQEFR
jgi:hypothetical protein